MCAKTILAFFITKIFHYREMTLQYDMQFHYNHCCWHSPVGSSYMTIFISSLLQCSPFITLSLGSIGMDNTILQRKFRKWPFYSPFSYNKPHTFLAHLSRRLKVRFCDWSLSVVRPSSICLTISLNDIS